MDEIKWYSDKDKLMDEIAKQLNRAILQSRSTYNVAYAIDVLIELHVQKAVEQMKENK